MEEMAVLDDTSSERGIPVTPQDELKSVVTEPPRRKNPWRLISALLVVALIVTSSLWFSIKLNADDNLSEANTTIDQLESDLDEACQMNDNLESDLTSLDSNLTSLESDYSSLLQEHAYLESELEELVEDYDDLESDYEQLDEDYDGLKSDYSSLNEEYELYERLSLESLASDYYQTIREEVGPQSISWWYYDLGTWQDQVDFCANLAKHNQAEVYWPAFEDEYYEFYESHSYDDALATLDFVLDFAGVSDYDSPVNKIDKILTFINNFIEYQPDMIDKFFAPVETLSYGSGDCDDFAILAAALFEVAGIDAAIGFFTDIDEVLGHAMTLVRMDDLDGYGNWYFPDVTAEGLISGKWIVIEPQMLISEQGSDWIGDWGIIAAADT